MDIVPHKRCSKCSQRKPLDQFSQSKAHKDGLYPSCKTCHNADSRDYHQRNKEQMRARGRDYYQRNREKVLTRTIAYQRRRPDIQAKARKKWVTKNRERVRLIDYRWRSKNREKDRANARRWRREHPEQKRAYHRMYWKKHQPRLRAYLRQWRSQNRELLRMYGHRYRTRLQANGGNYTPCEWEALKAQYQYRCLCCGKQEPDITLTVDHVIPVSQGGSNNISNIQPLCLSCNCSKSNRHTTDYRTLPVLQQLGLFE